MTLKGKGFFIWKIPDCENGDIAAITNLTRQAGFSHILVKIADGTYTYNYDYTNKIDLAARLTQALRAQGIQVWGWHYIYGEDPVGEANKAIQRIQELNLDGYSIDAEGEFKRPGKDTAARKFMDRLRSALPTLPISLCSYRFPSYHPQIPWKIFLEKCDYNQPQVYWQLSHNPADQLDRSVREFQGLAPFRPILPVGSAYKSGSWAPTATDVQQFLKASQNLNLSAASFWEWSNCRKYLPEVWDAIALYPWSGGPAPLDITQQYINALNTRDPEQVVGLYNPTAVHVNAARTIQGIPAINAWYRSLFNEILPGASFTHTGYTAADSSRHFTWTATSSAGAVLNGSDTLGLVDGKISYHYTFFTIS